MSLVIREATVADVPLLGEMHHKSHIQNYSYFMPKAYYGAINQKRFEIRWEERFKKNLYKQKAWIAELDGKPVGFCNAEMAQYYPEGYAGYLDNVHLIDGHIGKGIGKKMFDVCVDYMYRELGLEAFYLVVYQAHTKARKFYEALGGKELNFREYNVIAPDMAFTYTSYGWKK